jgi:hypothetical protein
MILFPNKDILTQEIQSWQGFAETLRSEDRKLFSQMLNDCYQLNESINSKGEYFSTESLLMGLVFVQHKIINWLINHNSNDIQQ